MLAHLGRYFGIGFAVMLANFSTLVLYIPAMKEAPRSARRALDPLNAFMARHHKSVTVTVCFAFAVYPTIKGARGL